MRYLLAGLTFAGIAHLMVLQLLWMLPLFWLLRAVVARRRIYPERPIYAAGTSRDHDGALSHAVPLRSTKRNLPVTALENTSSV
jgi:hypothetical protein